MELSKIGTEIRSDRVSLFGQKQQTITFKYVSEIQLVKYQINWIGDESIPALE